MRSRDELLAASGYGSHPNDFADLLRILGIAAGSRIREGVDVADCA